MTLVQAFQQQQEEIRDLSESRADMNGRKLKANEPPTSWEARSQEKKVQGQ